MPASRMARGRVITREDAVLCGTAWFDAAFPALEPDASVIWHARDGERIKPGQLLRSRRLGPRPAHRRAHRPQLRQLLSGTATLTATYVQAVAGTKAKIVDTRKTLPGLRLAQKYAVRVGGGTNHRIGLYDGILIKENHIIAAGSIKAVIEQARSTPRPTCSSKSKSNLGQLDEALAAGAKMILLDNMEPRPDARSRRHQQRPRRARSLRRRQSERVRAIAETGVDRISIGSLTKDVRAIDLSLRHVEEE
jgi:nicotinate-nucleotide pyrophosphorylase (carboxylating)